MAVRIFVLSSSVIAERGEKFIMYDRRYTHKTHCANSVISVESVVKKCCSVLVQELKDLGPSTWYPGPLFNNYLPRGQILVNPQINEIEPPGLATQIYLCLIMLNHLF